MLPRWLKVSRPWMACSIGRVRLVAAARLLGVVCLLGRCRTSAREAVYKKCIRTPYAWKGMLCMEWVGTITSWGFFFFCSFL